MARITRMDPSKAESGKQKAEIQAKIWRQKIEFAPPAFRLPWAGLVLDHWTKVQ